MVLWQKYRDFSPEFLEKHHSILLYDAFHHIKAYLLYPPNCSCKILCKCESFRAKIILSLNLDLFHQTQGHTKDPELIAAMRHLLRIPEDSFLNRHCTQLYPLWLIEENFQKQDQNFKIVDRLVWTLLRLVESYAACGFGDPCTSLKEALDVVLGKLPLQSKQKADYLCGEKEYRKQFNAYMPVCHFIAAYEFIKRENDQIAVFPAPSDLVEKFFNVSHCLQTRLLPIKTPNVKEGSLFSKKALLPLPEYLKGGEIEIPIEPFNEKLQEIESAFLLQA